MFSRASLNYSVHNRPRGYSVTAHPCYGAVGMHPTRMLSSCTGLCIRDGEHLLFFNPRHRTDQNCITPILCTHLLLLIIMTISDSAKCLDAIHFGDLLMHDTDYFYRPQRSCGQGNIFAPVCHSVHRVGVCLSACWDTTPLEQTPPTRSRPPPREQYFSCE